MRFYHVQGLQVWGDYGDALVNGYVKNDLNRRANEILKLDRTGPFMPPITFPANSPVVVVSHRFREELTASTLGPLKFRPVAKDHIVELHWERWDRNAASAAIPRRG